MRFEIEGVSGDIRRSLDTLLSTPIGTLVLDREYGVDWDGVDAPPEVAETMLLVEVEEKIARYEPRVIIEDISSMASADGILTVKVVVSYANQESASG